MQLDKLHDVYLALGTNLGDKEENIMQALKYINERVGMVIAHSAFYITEPMGFESDNKFINAACTVLTELKPLALLSATQQIEIEMGRAVKSEKEEYADRVIDIDILLYDELILEHKDLILPHPHMHQRAFVLRPLVELAGDYIHPVLKRSLYELESELGS